MVVSRGYVFRFCASITIPNIVFLSHVAFVAYAVSSIMATFYVDLTAELGFREAFVLGKDIATDYIDAFHMGLVIWKYPPVEMYRGFVCASARCFVLLSCWWHLNMQAFEYADMLVARLRRFSCSIRWV